MSEIKTQPVKAIHEPDKDNFLNERIPGSFRLGPDINDNKSRFFWYCCPCGCGNIGALRVGENFKPEDAPSWNWNGSIETPNLTPSVNHVGHWHGWLQNGTWVSC